MSTYHCSVKIVSRSSGRSSVGAAAYRAGEKITNERDGITHDYTRKGGVVYSEILLPQYAPIAYSERALLWNAVEKSETRANSQTAREIEIALPCELNHKEQAGILREYIKENFVSRGMCADYSIHDKGDGNPHAHIMLTMRSIDKNGKWESKAKFVYELDKNGNKQYNPKTRKYKGRPQNTNDWNQKENVEIWRESWARIYNREMEKKSLPERVDHRSYERQGIEREPTIHRGPAAHHMEMRGIETERGNINRGIEARNQRYTNRISELWEDVNAYTADGVPLFPYEREALSVYGIELPEVPQGTPIITYVEPPERAADQGGPDLWPVVLDKEFVISSEDSRQSHWTILPMSQDERVWLDYSRAEWDEGGHKLTAVIEADKRYTVYDWMGFESRKIEGGELYQQYQSGPKKPEASPERENGGIEARKGQNGKQAPKERKMQIRGKIEGVGGIPLPLGVRALLEMRRCQQIDNIQAMGRALRTLRQEGIKSYGEYDRRIGEYRQQMDSLNSRIDTITQRKTEISETIGPLEIYQKYMPYRREIEGAGIFQKKKLEQKYKLEMQGLEGAKARLQRMGTDPQTVTLEKQRERVEALIQEKIGLQKESRALAQKSLAVKESQKMMKQLFLDRGIDYERRSRERYRALDRGHER